MSQESQSTTNGPPTKIIEAGDENQSVVVTDLDALFGSDPEQEKTGMKLASLRHTPTAEETAERQRRDAEIRAGRHPDTGQRLTLADRSTLKPGDIYAFQMWREPSSRLSTAVALAQERTMAAFNIQMRIERERQLLLGTNLLDSPSVRWMTHLAERDLLPRSFSNRLDDQFEMHRLSDVGALASVAGRWKHGLVEISGSLDAAISKMMTASCGRPFDVAAMPSIVSPTSIGDFGNLASQRLLSVYGSGLADQTQFLADFKINTYLFKPPYDERVLQAADLLSRPMLPGDVRPSWDFYLGDQIERARAFAKLRIRDLETDFQLDSNPVFVWEAYDLAESYDLEVPEWVSEYFRQVAGRVCELAESDTVSRGPTEAELIGRTMGFGAPGKGQSSQIGRAKIYRRDRALYFAVQDWIDDEAERRPGHSPKLTSAYEEVAANEGEDRSTVQRAYRRFADFIDDKDS